MRTAEKLLRKKKNESPWRPLFRFPLLSVIGGNVMSEVVVDRRLVCPGSARVARAGDGVSPSRTFGNSSRPTEKIVSARHRNQHARRARYPKLFRDTRELLAIFLLSSLAAPICYAQESSPTAASESEPIV